MLVVSNRKCCFGTKSGLDCCTLPLSDDQDDAMGKWWGLEYGTLHLLKHEA
jgi:hypothetical protein